MSFEAEIITKNNREMYSDIKRRALAIAADINRLITEADAFKAGLPVDKQLEIDALKSVLQTKLNAIFGA